jgi:hypothetical protein
VVKNIKIVVKATIIRRDQSRKAIKGCRNLLSRLRKGQEPKDLMQTYIDRRSPSQIKVGEWRNRLPERIGKVNRNCASSLVAATPGYFAAICCVWLPDAPC